MQFSQLVIDITDVHRFVAFAAPLLRCKEGTVRFDK